MKTVQVERAQLEQWLQAFKKIHGDKRSHWDVDEEISAIEKSLEPIAMDVMKTDEADFWRWWKPYQLKDCWRLELVARDAWMAAKATKQQTEQHARNAITWTPDTGYVFSQPKEPEQEPVAWMLNGFPYKEKQVQVGGSCRGQEFPNQTPLYTTPPQRKPLTDEEIERIRIEQEFDQWAISEGAFKYAARAIEAAHGIKE